MATKQPKVFERSYSDKDGAVAFTHNDEEVTAFNMADMNPAMVLRGAARYFADIISGTGNAAKKAEGGTIESAKAKMEETIKALREGTFTFRSASGSASLSLEEEASIIAETLVSLGKVADKETGLAKVAALYAVTKKAANGNVTRPNYTALRNIPAIKDALAKAMPGSDEKLDSLLADPKPETEAQPAAATA